MKFTKEHTQEMRKVADFFDLLEEKGAEIGMNEARNFNQNNECNSPACFGGWLSIMYNTPIYDDEDYNGYRLFSQGANSFAKKIGFTENKKDNIDAMLAMEIFFQDEPGLWGNTEGYDVFSEQYAFNEGNEEYSRFRNNITPKAIANKWRAVAERIESSKYFVHKKKPLYVFTKKTQTA